MAAATTASQISTKSPTIRRILREAAELSGTPSSDYTAEPLESDLFEWHFTMRGPPNSVYSQGIYHGRIVLPPAYPLRPPSFRFSTPNGRFEANREICLSISGHHEETWQPAWGIRTALVALRSFMETDARGQLGGLETTEAVRCRLALESASFRCSICVKTNAEIIAGCEDRCKQATSPKEDIQVPMELSMGWRDEMEAKKGQYSLDHMSTGLEKTIKDDDPSDAEFAEGFIQTAPLPASPTMAVGTDQRPTRQSPHISTESGRAMGRDGGDGVPLWIDRAIVALVVMLIAILLKILVAI